MNKKHFGIDIPWPNLSQAWAFARKWLLPNPGTLVLMVILALALPAIAGPSQAPSATSTSTISYQGRLADAGGNPLTGKYNLEFRIYDVPTGGTPLWTEMWTGANSVDVSDGLFNVMMGSIDNTLASSIEGHDELYLGITVGTDSEMVPRVQLGSVPFSMQALTVPDGSITTEKIATGAITTTHILDGAVADDKLANEKINKAGDSGVGSLHFPRYSRLYFNYDGTNEAQIGGDLGHGPRLYLNGNTQDVWIRPGLRVQGDLTVDGIVEASNLDRGYTAYGIGNGSKPNRQVCKVACGGPDSDDDFGDYWIWDAGIYQTSTNGAWISLVGNAHVAPCNGCAVICTCIPYKSW